MRDCHWTSLNFFREQPIKDFATVEGAIKEVFASYLPVVGNPMLGDVIMFMRPDGVAVHSCVYVADDIVFTKNGRTWAAPWILTTLPDVLATYPSSIPLTLRYYRLKEVPE